MKNCHPKTEQIFVTVLLVFLPKFAKKHFCTCVLDMLASRFFCNIGQTAKTLSSHVVGYFERVCLFKNMMIKLPNGIKKFPSCIALTTLFKMFLKR